MKDSRYRILPVLVASTLTCGTLGAQQAPQGLTGTVEGSGQAIKIAVPVPEAEAAVRAAAVELAETVRADLDFAGDFAIVDPERYAKVPAQSGKVKHEDWIAIDADHLLLTRLKMKGDRVDLEAWLYDNTSGTLLFGQRYGGTTDLLRRVAHKLSDEVVKHYTGRNGIALSRIAFVSKHGENKEIYLMDYDGRRVRRLTTSNTINLSPVWSPIGDELAFVSWRGRQPGVYVMSAEGKLGVLKTVGGELSSAPNWAPDGRRLVYSSDVNGNTEVYILDRNSGRNTRLTFNEEAIDTSPAVSPNGRQIAFTSDRSGAPQIYVMDSEGVNVRRVSQGASYCDSPSWSPDGGRLAYAARIEGKFQIVVLDLTAGTAEQITRERSNHEDPSWSPDGRHLIYAGDASGSFQLHTMRADGTRPRQLTKGSPTFTPDWS